MAANWWSTFHMFSPWCTHANTWTHFYSHCSHQEPVHMESLPTSYILTPSIVLLLFVYSFFLARNTQTFATTQDRALIREFPGELQSQNVSQIQPMAFWQLRPSFVRLLQSGWDQSGSSSHKEHILIYDFKRDQRIPEKQCVVPDAHRK